ncbi:MAG: sigma-70 family RNA polymerase sigma factor [Oscillospiraceae bacterium]|jgi:RNA polymerase sigma factor (sigma-70 family)|nr:sigma-70 family RNA polymerase sigma factor [Oscillospiraceae bacterium]
MNNDRIGELALKAAQGDLDAFQELYLGTRQRAWFTALSIAKNETDAQDILQESYLKVYKNLTQLEKPELFLAWLNQIVANQAKNYISRRRPDSFAEYDDDNAVNWQEETDPAFLPDENLDQQEAKALIAKLVKSLPEDQRLVVLMHYYNEMDVADVAKALEVPEGTVKSRLSRARQKLATMLNEAQGKGLRLYSVMPIPFLAYFIQLLGFEESPAHRLPPLILGTAAGGAAAAGATEAALSSASKRAAKGASLPAKIAALATAATIAVTGAVGGSIAVYRRKQRTALESQSSAAVYHGKTTQVIPIGGAETTTERAAEETAGVTDNSTGQPTAGTSRAATSKAATAKASTSKAATTTTTASAATTTDATTSRNVTLEFITTQVTNSTYPPYTYSQASNGTFPQLEFPSLPTWTTRAKTTTATTPTTTTATTTTTHPPTTTTTVVTTEAITETFLVNPASNLIVRYTGTAVNVTVPAIVDGVAMKHLGDEAFKGTPVERVIISEGIDCIRDYAFAECPQLTAVEIPRSVKNRIGEKVFSGSPHVVLYLYEGSYADTWAKNNGFTPQYLTD